MRIKTIVLCGAILLTAGHQEAHAQGFLNKIKKVTKQVEQKVDNVLDRKPSKGKMPKKSNGSKTRIDRQVDAMVGPSNNRNAEDQAPTVRIPKNHTALLAPLGYDIGPVYGVKTVTLLKPPAKADKQEAWRDKMPDPRLLTNACLVDMFEMLSDASDYADMSFTPAGQYRELVDETIRARIDVLENMRENIEEVEDKYDIPDTYNWSINMSHRLVVRDISSDAYKALVRSSVEPLFTLEKKFDDYTEMTSYFEKHGGMKNTHKMTLTKWDPEPNKEKVSTSSGVSGSVVDSNASGGTIDISGVYYIVHIKQNRAIVKHVEKDALRGKDIVIPDYVTFKGTKYPVTLVAASAFENAQINSVKLPSKLKEIGLKAFKATNIKELVIPASVKKVEGSAFAYCPNLTKVTFAASQMELIEGCFAGCHKLQSVTFPASLTRDMTYDMFRDCPMLTTVTLPKNLRTVPQQMFSGCKSLRKIDLPATVTKIDGHAFSGCPITDLVITSVTEVDDSSFMGCKSLKTITINKTLRDKLIDDNYWLYTTNFSDNPSLQLVVKNGQVSLPAGVKVQ
mgnify:FL=1